MTPPLQSFHGAPEVNQDAFHELLTAISVGNLVAVHRLLLRGMDPEITDASGFAPLHAACFHGHFDLARMLLEFGADVNQRAGSAVQRSSQQGVHISEDGGFSLMPLMIAAAEGHHRLVKFLLEQGADVNAVSEGGITALMAAASMGQTEVVQTLVAAGAPLEQVAVDGSTALVLAAETGHLDTVRLLRALGATIDPPCSPSIIYRVAAGGYDDVLRELLWSGASYHGFDAAGQTALCVAASAGFYSVIETFLDFGITVNDLVCTDGSTALHCAVRAGDIDIVALLIIKGAYMHQEDSKGYTPLHLAIEAGNLELVEILFPGNSFFQAAYQQPSSAGTVQPLPKGTPDHKEQAKALHLACQKGHANIVEYLLNRAVDVNISDDQGRTPLETACDKGHVAIAELLISKGAEVTLANDDFASALVSLSKDDIKSVIKRILMGGFSAKQAENEDAMVRQQMEVVGHNTLSADAEDTGSLLNSGSMIASHTE